MTYRLIAIDDNDSPRAIGRYPDYESALLARITDVIDQLRANDGWSTRADHVIVATASTDRTPNIRCAPGSVLEPTVTGFPSTMTSRRRIGGCCVPTSSRIPRLHRPDRPGLDCSRQTLNRTYVRQMATFVLRCRNRRTTPCEQHLQEGQAQQQPSAEPGGRAPIPSQTAL